MLEKKYQVFISSTYTDLVEARTKVRDAILSLNHFPVGMEYFGAANEEQWQVISDTIDSSDYYILIIGQRYGSVISKGADKGLSYTEKEFKYALKKGIPVLAFILDDSVPVKPDNMERENLEKLEAFKKNAKNGRLVAFWKTTDELAQKVTAALSNQIKRTKRPGWIRGDVNELIDAAGIDSYKEFNLKDVTSYFSNQQVRLYSLEARRFAIVRFDIERNPVFCSADNQEEGDIFQVIVDNEGWAYFLASNGRYLQADLDEDEKKENPVIKAYGPKQRFWEQFKIYKNRKNNSYVIMARCNGRWISFCPDKENNPLHASAVDADTWERFEIRRAH